MADQHNVDILRRGIAAWNDWRQAEDRTELDLSHVDFSAVEFPFAAHADDPYDGYLSHIDLQRTNLSDSMFAGLFVSDADFSFANLQRTVLRNATFARVKFRGADLRCADLRSVRFVDCEFADALLQGAAFDGAIFDTTGRRPAPSSVARFLDAAEALAG